MIKAQFMARSLVLAVVDYTIMSMQGSGMIGQGYRRVQGCPTVRSELWLVLDGSYST